MKKKNKKELQSGLALPDWITGKPKVTKTEDGLWIGERFFPNLPDLTTDLKNNVDVPVEAKEEKVEKEEDR